MAGGRRRVGRRTAVPDPMNNHAGGTMTMGSKMTPAGTALIDLGPKVGQKRGRSTPAGGFVSKSAYGGKHRRTWAVPEPKCYILRNQGLSVSNVSYTKTQLSTIPAGYSSGSRQSACCNISRLNLIVRVLRDTHLATNTASFRIILALAVRGDKLTNSQIFTDATSWNSIISPDVLASESYVTIADQIISMDCVPGQFAVINTGDMQMLYTERIFSISRDMMNLPLKFMRPAAGIVPSENAIVMFTQASSATGLPSKSVTYNSQLFFYDN